MSKQTVWLITMLSLMVVLSAYYIVTGPVEPVDEAISMDDEKTEVKTEETNPLELALFGTDDATDEPDAEGDSGTNEEEDETATEAKDTEALGGQDYFLTMHTERYSVNEQLIDKYTDVVTDPEASEEQVKEASQKLEELQATVDQVTEMEEIIRGEGYSDALVMHEAGKYDITVQSEHLTKKEVVSIIELIQDETEVPAANLTVSYHP